VNLPARWEGVLEQHEATVTSLSVNGCFLLSGGSVESKELLRLEIYLPNDEPVYVWAEVVDQAYEIGFAARFTSPSDDEDQARLLRFINEALRNAS
jgi:PilZ domain